MLLFLRRHRRVLRQGAPLDASASVESQDLKLPNADNEGRSNQRIMGVKAGDLLAYGIPVMLGALAMPLIGLVDVFTVPRLLSSVGSEVENDDTVWCIQSWFATSADCNDDCHFFVCRVHTSLSRGEVQGRHEADREPLQLVAALVLAARAGSVSGPCSAC